MPSILKSLSACSKNFFPALDTAAAKLRMSVAETRDILRKRSIYRQVCWSKQEKKEFNEYWRTHFGKTISPRCHKYCQFFTGKFDVRLFPETLVTTRLVFRLNSYQQACQLHKKSWHELLVAGSSDGLCGVKVPRTLGVRDRGFCYGPFRQVLSFDELCAAIEDHGGKLIVKPLGESSGKGIDFFDLEKGEEESRRLRRSLEKRPEFLIQETLRSSSELTDLYSGAVNTFRVITYICDGSVYHCPAALRVGSGGGNVDNIHYGGMCVGVDDASETLRGPAYRLGYGEGAETFEKHPDSGVSFEGYRVPGIRAIFEKAHAIHGRLSGFGLIAWDWTLGEDGEPVLVEINLRAPGTAFLQVTNREPLFGSNTEKMISLIR